jgi:hypothetical protein
LGPRGTASLEWGDSYDFPSHTYDNPPPCETFYGAVPESVTGWWIPLQFPGEDNELKIAGCVQDDKVKVHLSIYADSNRTANDCSDWGACIASDDRSDKTTYGTELKLNQNFKTVRTNDFCIVASYNEFRAGDDYYLLVELDGDRSGVNQLFLEALVIDKEEEVEVDDTPTSAAAQKIPRTLLPVLLSVLMCIAIV